MIVLDTHVWIWFLSNPDLLSDAAQNRIELAAEKDDIFISFISVWEVALLVQKKRLALKIDVSE